MDRSKIVAIVTGAISILLAVIYLLIVQILDFRGEMLPAPQGRIPSAERIATLLVHPAPALPPANG